MPKVIIPTAYRGPTQGAAEVEVEGASVRACLEALESGHEGFLPLVVDEAGDLHRFVRLFLNGEPLEDAGLEMAVASDDEIEIIAAIAGG